VTSSYITSQPNCGPKASTTKSVLTNGTASGRCHDRGSSASARARRKSTSRSSCSRESAWGSGGAFASSFGTVRPVAVTLFQVSGRPLLAHLRPLKPVQIVLMDQRKGTSVCLCPRKMRKERALHGLAVGMKNDASLAMGSLVSHPVNLFQNLFSLGVIAMICLHNSHFPYQLGFGVHDRSATTVGIFSNRVTVNLLFGAVGRVVCEA